MARVAGQQDHAGKFQEYRRLTRFSPRPQRRLHRRHPPQLVRRQDPHDSTRTERGFGFTSISWIVSDTLEAILRDLSLTTRLTEDINWNAETDSSLVCRFVLAHLVQLALAIDAIIAKNTIQVVGNYWPQLLSCSAY